MKQLTYPARAYNFIRGMEQRVILVDEQDNEIGTAEKLEAHRDAKLHRAFSIFIFNTRGELMLQKRAAVKYHSAGLWANTCCSHPMPGESLETAVHRKLQEEMGFDCNLSPLFHFIYHVQLPNGLYEHELDHVWIGHYNADPIPNPLEVESWRWVDPQTLRSDIQQFPQHYSYWLAASLDRVLNAIADEPRSVESTEI